MISRFDLSLVNHEVADKALFRCRRQHAYTIYLPTGDEHSAGSRPLRLDVGADGGSGSAVQEGVDD